MAKLEGQSIAASYDQLLHVDRDGGGNTTTHVSVKDGDNDTTFALTLATDAVMITSTNRLEFGDNGTYIHQSADGVLDLVSDTELELNATTIDINGAVDISGDTTIAGDVIMADGKGIDFSAYTNGSVAGSTTSQILKDYEEGTWTGTLTSATPPSTPPTDTGYYTKIGRLVHVIIRIENADTTGGSGAMSITGLPFTVGNSTGMGVIAMHHMAKDTNDTITAWFDVSTTSITVYETANNAAWTQLSITAGAGKYMQISGSYTV